MRCSRCGAKELLRTFYGKVEAKDQETLVLTRAAGAAAQSGPQQH